MKRITLSQPARTLAAGGAAIALALAMTGCGNDSDSSNSSKADSSASSSTSTSQSTSEPPAETPAEPKGQGVSITVAGDQVSPTRKAIKVKAGKSFTFTVKADREVELHVHSSPEQELTFEPGTNTKKVTFDTPGMIEVEEHKTDTLIAQLEVR